MYDIRNAYLILIFIYTFVIYIMLLFKDRYSNKRTFGTYNVFNICLTIFLVGILLSFFGINFYDKGDIYSIRNVIVAKMYCIYLFSFVTFLSSYYCVNVYNFDLHLIPNKNLKSMLFFIYFIVSIGFILALPITINIVNSDFTFTGWSPYFTVGASFISYSFVLILFFKNIKKLDYYKSLSSLLFFILIILCVYFQYRFDFSLYELINAFSLVVTYFGVEKREEKVQNEINEAIISLEKGARFKSDFLSSMSHEIKTPLNSILYTFRNLDDNYNLNYNVRRDINDIVFASDTLQEIISNMLMINKIENDDVQFNKINYNISSEIKTLPFVEKMKINPKGVSFFVDIEKNVPDLIYGEKEIIRIIINNVLSYSVHYVNNGSLTLKVLWNDLNPNNQFLVIDIELIEEGVKELYNDIDNLTVSIFDCVEKYDFGLGLASILTKKLNGKIECEYEENRNDIIFTIPHSVVSNSIDFEAIKYNNLKVLVVDDVKLNLKIADKLLKELGVICTTCESGNECLDLISKEKFDYIFLDIMMPNMSGEETLSKLKSIDGFNTPVIALTADEISGAKEKYLEAGFSNYIVKPFTKSDIINVLGVDSGGDK